MIQISKEIPRRVNESIQGVYFPPCSVTAAFLALTVDKAFNLSQSLTLWKRVWLYFWQFYRQIFSW